MIGRFLREQSNTDVCVTAVDVSDFHVYLRGDGILIGTFAAVRDEDEGVRYVGLDYDEAVFSVPSVERAVEQCLAVYRSVMARET